MKKIYKILATAFFLAAPTHAAPVMIDAFEHSDQASVFNSPIRKRLDGYVTTADSTGPGNIVTYRGGYLLNNSGNSGSCYLHWDGHRLLYQSSEIHNGAGKVGGALFMLGYNNGTSRAIPRHDLAPVPDTFSLAGQTHVEVLFNDLILGSNATGLTMYLRMGDNTGKQHTVTVRKINGAGAVLFPLAAFQAEGLDLSKLLGLEVYFTVPLDNSSSIPAGTDFKLEHIRALSTTKPADSDGDGAADTLEYALGGDPIDASKTHAPTQAKTILHEGKSYAAITYRQREVLDSSIAIEVEVSKDLITWKKGTSNVTQVSNIAAGNGMREITVRANEEATGNSRCFLRVKATQN